MIDIFIWFLFASFISFLFYYFDFNTEGFWWLRCAGRGVMILTHLFCIWMMILQNMHYHLISLAYLKIWHHAFSWIEFFCVLLFLIFISVNSVHAINDDDMNSIWFFSDYHKQIHHLSAEIADTDLFLFYIILFYVSLYTILSMNIVCRL